MRPSRPAIFLVFALSLLSGAPVPDYSRRVWRSEDGLPQNRIQVVSQTADGYLWIGTSGGLVRFDGVRFVVFDRSNTPAFRDDSILSLCPARSGALWVGTEGGGLLLLDHGVFKRFGQAAGLTNGFVRSLFEDHARTLWVGTDRGFFRMESGRLHRLDGREGIPIFAPRAIAEDDAGRLWLGTSTGIYRVENGRVIATGRDYEAFGNNVLAIYKSRNGSLWFGGDAGLGHVVNDRVVAAGAGANLSTRSLGESRDGSLWVGTAGAGLVRLRDERATFFRAPEPLPDNTVYAVFEDRESNLWVGTDDGLLRLARTAVSTLTGRDGLADDNVATVYQDSAGALWIATATGRIYSFADGHLSAFDLNEPRARQGALRARSVYRDRSGSLWFGTLGQGALRYRAGETRSFTMADGLRSNNIRQFLETADGAVWMATGSGLSRWDGKALRTFYLEDGLAYGGVRALAQDRSGDLLVGTDGGLNRVRAGRFVADPAFAQLGNARIWTILPAAEDTLWLGTRGDGLFRIRANKIKHFTTRDGLLSNSIYQILDDGLGRFWIATPAGIFSVDRSELDAFAEGRPGPIAIVPYGAGDGLDSTQMNGGIQLAGCRSKDGNLWFASVKGAVRIDPRQSGFVGAPPVLIESLALDGRMRPLGASVTIPAGRGKIEIDYTSCALRSPDRVTFKYKLDGFDHDWISAPKRRSAVYANLPPGRYRFRVLARDGAFPGNVSEASLPFQWQPYFWETLWFRLCSAIAAGLLIWLAFIFYSRQTQARYALVLAERTRVAREMHDTVLQGCVGVSTLLEAASMLPQAQPELVEHARAQIRLIIEEAREALWDLRNPALERDFAGLLRSFAQRISATSGIPVRAEINAGSETTDEHVARSLLLVAREAIRNAVAHAKPTEVTVKLDFKPGAVTLEVTDNGLGFVPEAAGHDGHYGILGMRERVEKLSGAFSIVSAPGHGATVRVVVPLHEDGSKGRAGSFRENSRAGGR